VDLPDLFGQRRFCSTTERRHCRRAGVSRHAFTLAPARASVDVSDDNVDDARLWVKTTGSHRASSGRK
jgi:hypothetical protein